MRAFFFGGGGVTLCGNLHLSNIDSSGPWISWMFGFHGFLDFVDFWTGIFGLGFLDLMDFWISRIFGFHGFLDLVDFYSDFGTVCVQGALTSQE